MNIVKNLNYKPTENRLSKKGDGEFSHKIKNILRPLINPLKGTHNIDLLRLILSDEWNMNILAQKFKTEPKIKHKMDYVENDEKKNKSSPSDLISDFVYKRLLVPTQNGILTISEKAYLAAALSITLETYLDKKDKNKTLEFILIELYGYPVTRKENEEADEIKDKTSRIKAKMINSIDVINILKKEPKINKKINPE